MNAHTVSFLNFGIHCLVLAAAGWLITRFCIRDARRRSIAANLALIIALSGAFDISFWPYPFRAEKAPVLEQIHHTLQPDWRITIKSEPMVALVEKPHVPAPGGVMVSADDLVKWLRWIYWAVAALLLVSLLAQSVRVQRWAWRLRRPTKEESAALSAAAPLARLRVFEHEGSPGVAGWFAPVIAVPASAFSELTPRQWRWLIRHEQEHLRCNDTAAAFLHSIIRALAWWNPFIHALIESYACAREEVCDAVAMRDEREGSDYAGFLLDVAARSTAPGVCVLPMAQSKPARRLKARLSAIIGARGVRQRLGALFVLACAVFAVLGAVLVSSIGIATSATAQEPATATAKPQDAEMFTRVLKVSPDFAKDASDAKSWLQERGVSFPDGAGAVFERAASHFVVKNTKANLDKIAELVAAGSVVAPQVQVTSKIIVADRFFGGHGQVLSDQKRRDQFLSSLHGVAVVELVSLPSVTTMLAQRATVEVIREGPTSDPPKFAGTKLEVGALPKENGRVEASIHASFGTDDGERLLDTRDISKVDWSRVIIMGIEARAKMVSGETLVAHLKLGEQCVTTLVTMVALAPDGRPAPRGFGDKMNLVPADELEKNKTDLQDARDFDVIAKQVAERNAAAERKRIYLTAKVVDVTQPKDSGLNLDWMFDGAFSLPSASTSGSTGSSEKPKAAAFPPPGILALTGVLTDPQFQVVIRALNQRKGTTIAPLPSATVKPDAAHTFVIPKELEGVGLTVTPVIGPDGYTIDLNISASSTPPADAAGKVKTAVMIWDGQTVVLGGLKSEDDKGKHSRLIFITARIIDPAGQPAKK